MTSPGKLDFGTKKERANWLDRYLGVEKDVDRKLYDALLQAAEDIDTNLAKLAKSKAKSAAMRRLQVSLARKEIRRVITALFGKQVLPLIKSGHEQAAQAAVDAAMKQEESLLKKVFPNAQDRASYAKSLRASAARDIDATMTRVLQTNRPLSKRVWATRALAQGQVDRAVNAALARGDSFEQLAKDVRTLVDPATPGGVTYAAKRLARTEINNAFHAQSIRDAQEMPWITGMRWHLSQRHMNYPGDPCEEYAQQGYFPIESVPDKPHPHCRCFVTPEAAPEPVVEHMFQSGQLDNYLDNFLAGNGLDPSLVGTPSAAPAPAPKAKPKKVAKKAAPKAPPKPKAHKPKVERRNTTVVPDASGKLSTSDAPAGTSANPHLFHERNEQSQLTDYGMNLTVQNPSMWRETEEGARQLDSIINYTEGETAILQHYARTGKQLYEGDEVLAVSEDDLKALDSAFNSKHVTPMPDWTVVSRGSTLADFGMDVLESGGGGNLSPEDYADFKYQGKLKKHSEDDLKALVGKEFTNKGYTSTTLADRPAMNSQVRVLFRLPPGTRGLYVGGNARDYHPLSKWGGEELEVILPRNLKYKVVDAGFETVNSLDSGVPRFRNEYLVVVEVLP